jgi:pilus assembly protein CpaB
VEWTGRKYARRDWQKLLATRRGTVLVAVVCAVLAAVILVVAMQSYRSSVNAEGAPVSVLVSTGPIQKGTSGDAIASGQLFKATSVPGKQANEGAFADTAQLRGKVATENILPGQQLTAREFGGSGGLASELAPDQRAMTVTFDSARGMVGQIETGDHVDVYGDLEAGSGRIQRTVLLMSDVEVLKAASSSGGIGLSGASSPQNQESNVTLKVDANRAGLLAFAADNGKVWLALRPANATSPSSSAPVEVTTLLNGSATTGGGT